MQNDKVRRDGLSRGRVKVTVKASSRRERNKQAVRARINRATIRLIQVRGIESVTVENICQRADVARMTFYNYYTSRHDLLDTLCRSELLLPVSGHFRRMAEEEGDLVEQLNGLLLIARQGFSLLDDLQRELIVYMIDNVSGDQADDSNQLDFFTATLEDFYLRHQQDIKSGLCPRFCAVATVGAMTGILMNWLNSEEYPVDSRLDSLAWLLADSFAQVPEEFRAADSVS
ncbi:MAG: TetR/AcrR family transcriptional regulator [Endozoicomonas sp.]